MADPVRHSSASEAEVITDPELAAKVEGENGVRQFRAVLDMVESFLDRESPSSAGSRRRFLV